MFKRERKTDRWTEMTEKYLGKGIWKNLFALIAMFYNDKTKIIIRMIKINVAV